MENSNWQTFLKKHGFDVRCYSNKNSLKNIFLLKIQLSNTVQ